jgi:hypothetical protein
MGSRYLFIILYVWLERHLSRGDYRRRDLAPLANKHQRPALVGHGVPGEQPPATDQQDLLQA